MCKMHIGKREKCKQQSNFYTHRVRIISTVIFLLTVSN